MRRIAGAAGEPTHSLKQWFGRILDGILGVEAPPMTRIRDPPPLHSVEPSFRRIPRTRAAITDRRR